MRIKHPSTFIKYISDEEYRQSVLKKAEPIWGKRVDKSGVESYIITEEENDS